MEEWAGAEYSYRKTIPYRRGLVTLPPQLIGMKTARQDVFLFGWSMKRRKIRMDRGDTLGGTVPLLLRDHVTANSKDGRFLHKDRRDSRPAWVYGLFAGLLLVAVIGAWLLLPDLMERLGIPTAQDIWTRITDFFAVPEA